MRVLVVIGTRPEAIKMAPVVRRLLERGGSVVRVCLTGQHRELLAQGLADFHIDVHDNLDVMEDGQSVNDLVARVMLGMAPVLHKEKPDWVLVQGDTSSAMAAALAAFHHGFRIAHVEAGLRTGDPAQPWPEEINRRLIAQLADLHLAPTQLARDNLKREGVCPSKIAVCGNTVIDALVLARHLGNESRGGACAEIGLETGLPLILVTLHRRENLTPDRLFQVETALKALAADLACQVVFPVHPNPALAGMVDRLSAFHPHLKLIRPLNYVPFIGLLSQAALVLTDSGGLQEEAAFLGKPVLIMRACTERPEVLDGGAVLVGTDADAIIAEVSRVLKDLPAFQRRSGALSAFGHGGAADMIVDCLLAQDMTA